MNDSTTIVKRNAELKDNCLLFLHRLNAYNIYITEFDKYLSIQAKLPNQNIVTISCAHTVHIYPTTISFEDITIAFDPTLEESKLLHFLL